MVIKPVLFQLLLFFTASLAINGTFRLDPIGSSLPIKFVHWYSNISDPTNDAFTAWSNPYFFIQQPTGNSSFSFLMHAGGSFFVAKVNYPYSANYTVQVTKLALDNCKLGGSKEEIVDVPAWSFVNKATTRTN